MVCVLKIATIWYIYTSANYNRFLRFFCLSAASSIYTVPDARELVVLEEIPTKMSMNNTMVDMIPKAATSTLHPFDSVTLLFGIIPETKD